MHPNNQRGNNNNNRRRHPNNNRPNNGGNGGGNSNNNRRPQQNLRNQVFDSKGPDGVRVRGNAFQVHEKYLSLAREAEERIDQENYYQHSEHYYRIVEAINETEAEQRSRFAPSEQPSMEPSSGESASEETDNGEHLQHSQPQQQNQRRYGQHNSQQNGSHSVYRTPQPYSQNSQHNNQQNQNAQSTIDCAAAEQPSVTHFAASQVSEPIFSLNDTAAAPAAGAEQEQVAAPRTRAPRVRRVVAVAASAETDAE